MAKKKLNLRQEYEELQAMEYHLAGRSLAFFTRAAWEVLEPETPMMWNWHHDLICEHLQAVDEGQLRRLIINIAPRTMKSILATVCFPSWSWARRPHRRFMCGSYAESLAVKHNMMRRNLIESAWYQGGWGHRFKISSDSNTKAEFTNDKTGQMKSLGIMGSATGFGADCFPAGTMVETEHGPMDIAAIHAMEKKPMVLSFNHDAKRTEWRPVIASRQTSSGLLVEIRTGSGKRLIATHDHRIWTMCGYVKAAELILGEAVMTESLLDPIFGLSKSIGSQVPVYDIQVEGNHNFFAEGILVHNCLIVDDPHNPSGAESEAERESTVENFDLAWTSRLNNKKTGAIIVVMQRLHEKDLTGHLLAKNAGYTHLKIPSIAETSQTLYFPITKRELVREPGDVLHSARDGLSELAAAKKDMGEYGFCGQHQQEPVPRGGAMIKRHWFKVYRERPAKFDQIIQSWDFAVKAKTTSDYTVGLVIGRIGAEKYILDMVREQANFTGQLSMLVALSRKWPTAYKKVIESKANGPAIVAMLQKTVSGLVEVEPDGDKIARMNAISPDIEAGNVWVPDPSIAPWVSDFLAEVCNFPRATHDDTVDALTQGIRELRRASVASMPLAGHSGIIHGR